VEREGGLIAPLHVYTGFGNTVAVTDQKSKEYMACYTDGQRHKPNALMPISRKGEKMIEMLNMDCMEYMAGCADKAFELAIVDPPYGINAANTRTGSGWITRESKDWDSSIPSKEYFEELQRVSKNQIIWGGNYFTEHLRPSMGWIFWDKGQRDFSLADGELAWTSFNKALRVFDFSRAKLNQARANFHPTEKPVALYKWLLTNHAKPGDRIIDTHGGSGSICIACHDLGFDLTWMELDTDYYAAACKRYKDHAAQAVLFEPQEIIQKTYNNEFDLTS